MSRGVPEANTAPLTITVTCLAKRNTTSMSCSMMSTAMSLGSASMASRMMWLSALGTPAAGSSSSSTSGLSAGDIGEFQRLQKFDRFGDDVGAPADWIKHGPRHALAFGDGYADVFQNRQPAEQPVDLERARDAKLHPLGLALAGDVAAGEQHAALAGRQHAGEEIDERGLAGAIGADQGVAGAGFELEVDILHGAKRAEIAAERLRFEAGLAHVVLRRAL